MVDWFGNWTAESDYGVFSKNKWCDFDYIAAWIKDIGYRPKTTIENLVKMVFAHYEDCLNDNNIEFYTDVEESENESMISVKDVTGFIVESGGLEEFDYWC